jgi:Methyltransferase FkbM domain
VDNLVAQHNLEPRFMKIDVEGHEVEVLRGAHLTIERYRPDLLLEYCPDLLEASGASGDELLAILRSLGYEIEWISRTELIARPR